MSHDPTCMARVENPTKRFCEVISGVQDPRAVREFDLFAFFPILDRKIRDINVSGTLSGMFSIHHLDGGHVIFVQPSSASVVIGLDLSSDLVPNSTNKYLYATKERMVLGISSDIGNSSNGGWHGT